MTQTAIAELVFLLEEPSAAAMLNGLLPRILPPEIGFRCVPCEGKQELEGQLERKLRGYRVPGARFVVLRDQDNGDCVRIKDKLMALRARTGRPDALVRIACQELESWCLADLAAVERGLNISGLARHQKAKKYLAPDRIGNPASELERLTGGAYQKMSGSRAIDPNLDLDNIRSDSFRNLVSGVRRLIASQSNSGEGREI